MITIEIDGNKIPYKIGHRAMIEYERQMGKSSEDVSTLEDSTVMMHIALKVSAQKHKLPFKMTLEQFIDYLDDHPELMEQFGKDEVSEAPIEEGKKKKG
mgnify:CR=1 FL=1